ncbi:hypothetical protein EC957_000519 [Mortierella hygrophila]|uniref:F-box domain-containing protein n=1 Tax=Mortierella hygrophila TaxID=979708 RepID=A0A9P6F7K1_9FUNG|nr:hypothetical protein EC957_000519 [Mortierella hygrophila]
MSLPATHATPLPASDNRNLHPLTNPTGVIPLHPSLSRLILGNFHMTQTTPNKKDEGCLLDLFRKHGRHIRHLQAYWCVTLNALAAAQTCTQLEALSVPGQSWNMIRPEMADSNRRTLQELKVHQSSKVGELDRGVLDGLLRSCPRLNTLGISDLYWTGVVHALEQVDTTSIVAQSKDLEVGSTGSDPGIILDHTPHRLERLDIGGIGFKNDDYFAKDALPWLPHLVDLSIQLIGPALAELIPTHYRNLRSYNQPTPVRSIHPKYPLPHSAINTLSVLLGNCPHLIEFNRIEHRVEADYLLDHPWVCKGLEVLMFQIVGVRRLSEEEGMDYWQGKLFLRIERDLVGKKREAIEKQERLQVQQRRVYDRLAEMVHLRVLDLGMEYRAIGLPAGRPQIRYGVHVYEDYGKPIPDTLELSLDSGLERLSTLKELDVVGKRPTADNHNNNNKDNKMNKIPTEILADIGSYLSLHDYLHCIQVSRTWNNVFIPFLWQTIDDSLHAWPRILKTLDSDTVKASGQDEDWLLGIFAKYGRHIQDLNLHWKVTIKAASTGNHCNNDVDKDKDGDIGVICTNLKSLSVGNIGQNLTHLQEKAQSAQNRSTALPPSTISLESLTGPLISPIFENAFKPHLRGTRTEDQQLEDWRLVQQLWLLVRQNRHHLQALRIDAPVDALVEMNTTGFVDSMVVDHLTQLVDLQYRELRCDTTTLLRRLPRLKTLQSQVILTDGVLTGSFSSLRCLRACRSMSVVEIVTLLQRLPNLSELGVTQINYMEEEEPVIERMDRTTPAALQSLRIDWSSNFDALSLQDLSAWLPHLTDLSVGQMRYDVAMILGDYYPLLESLTDPLKTTKSREGEIAIHSRVLAVVLSSCISLKSLDAQVHTIDMSFYANEP